MKDADQDLSIAETIRRKISEENRSSAMSSKKNPLTERYELLEQIGEDRTTVILKAKHIVLDRLVKVKLLKPEYHNDQDAKQKLQNEAREHARAGSSPEGTVADFGMTPDGRQYIVYVSETE
jgi:serine/threonine protein kinase